MIQPTVLANAVATVAGATYIICRLAAAAAPNLIFTLGQSLFHTINLESVRAATPMSTGIFMLGLATSISLSWIATYAVTMLYNQWAKR